MVGPTTDAINQLRGDVSETNSRPDSYVSIGTVETFHSVGGDTDTAAPMADVRDRITGGLHTHCEIDVNAPGYVAGLPEGTDVVVKRDDVRGMVVSSVRYTEETPTPQIAAEDLRFRRGEMAYELTSDSQDRRVTRLGLQPTDGEAHAAGLVVREDTSWELYGGESGTTGVCVDAQGRLSITGGDRTGLSAGTGGYGSNAPVNWQNAEPYKDVPRPDTQTVDLDGQISAGEDITDTIRDALGNGTTVILPPGEFQISGDPLPNELQSAELIGGGGITDPLADDSTTTTTTTTTTASTSTTSIETADTSPPVKGQVMRDGGSGSTTGQKQTILNAGASNSVEFDVTVPGGGDGSVHIRNLTLKGTKSNDVWLHPIVTDRQSSIFYENIFMPDGDDGGDGPTGGMFVNKSHSGTIYFRNGHVEGFSDNSIYASAPGTTGGAGGRIIAEGGISRNSNVSAMRPGGSGSAVRKMTLVHDQVAPSTTKHNNNVNQRGIWVRDNAREIVIEDCDIFQSVDGGPIVIGGGSGDNTVQSANVSNSRITNQIDRAAIRVTEGQVGGSGNSITGTNTDVLGASLSGTTSDTPARKQPRRV